MPGESKKEAVLVAVEEEDLKKKSEEAKGKKKKGGKDEPDEMSEEDKALKEGLEVAVARLKEDGDAALHRMALDYMSSEIKTATSSMTSVPKPLKFLREHYDALKEIYKVGRVGVCVTRNYVCDFRRCIGYYNAKNSLQAVVVVGLKE